jgi:large subunit ribosomal protein L17
MQADCQMRRPETGSVWSQAVWAICALLHSLNAINRSTDRRQKPGRRRLTMRHRNAGFKLGRNPSHRRAVLRNLVTSIILMDRVETTVTKCKATQPLVEKMITLGKRGTVHARRQALSYLMTPESVDRLFGVVAPRYGDRNGGYTRITRSGARQGDAAEMAYIELLGAEQELDAKRQKREEARAKKREEMAKQLEEQNPGGEAPADDTAA